MALSALTCSSFGRFFITRLLARDLTESKYSILNFWDRRIRRFLPALFVMFAVTLRAASLEALATRTGADYIPLITYVCGGVDKCYGIRDGTVIYFDEHHLSVTMAEDVTDHVILRLLESEK